MKNKTQERHNVLVGFVIVDVTRERFQIDTFWINCTSRFYRDGHSNIVLHFNAVMSGRISVNKYVDYIKTSTHKFNFIANGSGLREYILMSCFNIIYI